MAIIDERLEFADASADFNTNSTGTANVGDIIDLGAAGQEPGEGRPLYVHITVDVAGDGGGGAAGTTAFQLVSDSTDTIATDGNQTIHFTSDVYAGTALDQGDHFVFPLPSSTQAAPYERYLGLQVVQATEEEDDLVCSAWLSPFPGGGWRAHPDANN